jgi:hypothetical protein
MHDLPDAADTLLKLIHYDLSRCMAALDYLGASLASAHISAAIDCIRDEPALSVLTPQVRKLSELDLSPFDEAIERLCSDWILEKTQSIRS